MLRPARKKPRLTVLVWEALIGGLIFPVAALAQTIEFSERAEAPTSAFSFAKRRLILPSESRIIVLLRRV
jgi:hypothetical protein